MKRSLFVQVATRALAASALVAVVASLAPHPWMAVAAVLCASLWLAWRFVGLATQDDAALEAGLVALSEGREIAMHSVWRDHDRLAALLRSAGAEIERGFASSAERREKLEALLDSMQDAVTSVDAVGRIIWANKAMQRLVLDSFGSVRAGHSLVQTIRAPEVLECVHTVLETRTVVDLQPVSLAPGRIFAVSAAPMPEGGAVIVLRDITRIEQVERTQREFVANVSHELRTPLTSIQGYVEMLLDTEGTPLPARTEAEFLEAILKSARRMGRLTDDLLALARVESGEQKLEPRPVSAEALMREAAVAVAGVVKEKGGALEVGAIPEVVVMADVDAIVQILSNLIENALNYGRGPNGARVQLSVAVSATHPPEVRFR
ncbi:MAG TPA: histidine kinase dimerization/phospho-acceptor domain-containing protein, partial [Acidobacteriaceae bacterium]|nr:histidine kinase dimerization/phospho-acceptor domain-containing protein [Acidobacteriaceae bacterium]